ncbi:MAG: sugar ABC transporter substrate-binding protein [Candidatus Cloacimonadota bacterium]|nr:MAG: sugar ABC transporter substrate-binding protein [Candidatus Cloacimonadota bacterium]
MKKLILWLIVMLVGISMVATFSLAGCKPAVEEAVVEEAPPVEEEVVEEAPPAVELPMEGWVVGYLPGSLRDAARVFWSYYTKKGVMDAGAEEFIMIDSELDVTRQVADGEDILEMGIDILVMNPNDADAMIPIVEKANEMGIPVVCIDRATNGGDVICTTGLDNWQIGEEAAALLLELIGEGKVLHIQGTLGASVVYERGESFRLGLKDHPEIEIVGEPASEYWTAEDGLAYTEDVLTAHPDLVAVYTHTDTITEGAIAAVKAAGKVDQVTFFSQGWYGGIPDIMKEGSATVYDWAVDPIAIGKATADVCIKIAKGELDIIPRKIAVPNQLVTMETVDEYWEKLNLNLLDVSAVEL